MISKETCVKIWNAYNEIDSANELIKNMAETLKTDSEKKAPTIHNAFGDRTGLQLGLPSGNSSHRLYSVPVDLSVKIIEAHIQAQEQRLKELMAIAKIELNS